MILNNKKTKNIFLMVISIIFILLLLIFITKRGTRLNEIAFTGKVIEIVDEKVLFVDYFVKRYKRVNIEIFEIDGIRVKKNASLYIEINPLIKKLLNNNIFNERSYIESVFIIYEDGFYYIDEPHYELFNILTEEEYLIKNQLQGSNIN